MLKRIRRGAKTDATVMIQGESGTGKGLVAHAIHYQGGVPMKIIDAIAHIMKKGALSI